MKSVFPYLVMFVLFLAGTRLVNRQQTYIRSIQESTADKSASFTGMLATNEPDTGLTDVADNQTSSGKQTGGKKRTNLLIR
ncbi:hypothetical protein GO730_19860 [Spirosoma sp. HMF3257]|nr:hypothetical protein [Spirosoma telluris]